MEIHVLGGCNSLVAALGALRTTAGTALLFANFALELADRQMGGVVGGVRPVQAMHGPKSQESAGGKCRDTHVGGCMCVQVI
jgi:hypothetical protein